MSNGHVNIKFSWGLTKSDPEQSPVLFVGLSNHLTALEWNHVKEKLEPRVTEEVRKLLDIFRVFFYICSYVLSYLTV